MSSFFKKWFIARFQLVYIDDILPLAHSWGHVIYLSNEMHQFCKKPHPKLAPTIFFNMLLTVIFLGQEIAVQINEPLHPSVVAVQKLFSSRKSA